MMIPRTKSVFSVDPATARTTVWMGGVQTDVVVDSGASSNILSQEQWHQLQKEGIKYTPHEVHKQLFPYGSSKPLTILESFQTEAKTATSSVTAGFIAVQSKGPILWGRHFNTVAPPPTGSRSRN